MAGQGEVMNKKHPIYYCMTPNELVKDKNISSGACRLYALYHSFARPKDLNKRPKTYVSQRRLSEELGHSIPTISSWTKELASNGWIKVQRRGWKTNLVSLRARKRKSDS